jgi:hypothetical protein
MAKTARSLDLEPIERLEEKVRMLVGLVDRLRSGHQQAQEESARFKEEGARLREENARLNVELEGLQSRLSDVEHVNAELVALREERDHIRARVETILGQLEELEG